MTTPTPMTEAEIEEVEKRTLNARSLSLSLDAPQWVEIHDGLLRLLATIRERDKVIAELRAELREASICRLCGADWSRVQADCDYISNARCLARETTASSPKGPRT